MSWSHRGMLMKWEMSGRSYARRVSKITWIWISIITPIIVIVFKKYLKYNLVRSISILKHKYLKDNNRVKKRWVGYCKNRYIMIYRFKRKIRARRKNKKKNRLKQMLKWIWKIRKIFNKNQIGIIKLFRRLNQ